MQGRVRTVLFGRVDNTIGPGGIKAEKCSYLPTAASSSFNDANAEFAPASGAERWNYAGDDMLLQRVDTGLGAAAIVFAAVTRETDCADDLAFGDQW